MALPQFMKENIKADPNCYSLYDMGNVERCKIDSDYLGDVIVANEAMIWKAIHKYIKNPDALTKIYGVEKDDILQIGRIGFIKAINAFDTTRGIKFSSFAVTAIYREVRHCLRTNHGIIKISRGAQQLLHTIKKIENDLGYIPPAEDLSRLLGKSPKKIEALLRIRKTIRSLDEQCGEFEDGSMDIYDDPDIPTMVADKIDVEARLKYVTCKLTPQERQILMSHLVGLTQTNTAKKYNTTPLVVNKTIKKVKMLLNELEGLMCNVDPRND